MIEWLFDNVASNIQYIVCNCSYSVCLFFTSKSIAKSPRGNLYSWNVCTITFITHVPTLLIIQMTYLRKVRNIWNRLHNVICSYIMVCFRKWWTRSPLYATKWNQFMDREFPLGRCFLLWFVPISGQKLFGFGASFFQPEAFWMGIISSRIISRTCWLLPFPWIGTNFWGWGSL